MERSSCGRGPSRPRTGRKTPLILGDFKHDAANVLKKVLGADNRFAPFLTRLGQTRSVVQQTELAHFTPLGQKPKARFMNLSATLRWALMVSWHLAHPRSQARDGITAARMIDKLGWLRGFRDDLRRWSQCQAVIDAALTFINEQGVFAGAARALLTHWRTQPGHAAADRPLTPATRQVMARRLHFVRQAERQLARLPPGSPPRLPLSTEILESSFGLFKQLERQHARGGFTSLLAAHGCLLQPATPQSIRRDFAVSVRDVRQWSRRQPRHHPLLEAPNRLPRIPPRRLNVTTQQPMKKPFHQATPALSLTRSVIRWMTACGGEGGRRIHLQSRIQTHAHKKVVQVLETSHICRRCRETCRDIGIQLARRAIHDSRFHLCNVSLRLESSPQPHISGY